MGIKRDKDNRLIMSLCDDCKAQVLEMLNDAGEWYDFNVMDLMEDMKNKVRGNNDSVYW